jgi:AraC family transcriptional regulator
MLSKQWNLSPRVVGVGGRLCFLCCSAKMGARRFTRFRQKRSMQLPLPAPAPTPAKLLPKKTADSLGCSTSNLFQDQELASDGVLFYRKRKEIAAVSQVMTPGSARGFLIGISMGRSHRKIFRGAHASQHDFEAGSVYIRDFADDYRADLQGRFDFLLMEMPLDFFARMHDGNGAGARLAGVTGLGDPVLAHLALALAPALERPHEASALFVDQLSAVIGTHLFDKYGSVKDVESPKRRLMSRLHETRAKEMLRSQMDGDITIGAVAEACGLSRSHFTKAFRATTGQTPHQWLQVQRVVTAKGLLQHTEQSLAEIAAVCGFADQSHFTRVFTQAVGTTPGNWRRQVA